jgi:hypothetical protein
MIQWDIPLTTFKFKARDWKYLIEEYRGPTWFAECWIRDRDGIRPTSLQIPSPRMGRGGYSPEEFQNQPPQESWDTSPVDVDGEQEQAYTVSSIPGGTQLFPTRTDGSVHSSKSGVSQWSIPQATS